MKKETVAQKVAHTIEEKLPIHRKSNAEILWEKGLKYGFYAALFLSGYIASKLQTLFSLGV